MPQIVAFNSALSKKSDIKERHQAKNTVKVVKLPFLVK